MADTEIETDDSVVRVDPADPSLFTNDGALSLDEARSLTGRRGVTLVLLAGEVGVGKTTLLVELWNQLLLNGSLSSHRLAGSRTALAFEKRAYHSRIASSAGTATTNRTQASDDVFLHLRIQRPDGSLRELLLADTTGERFERIRQGISLLLEEFSWAARVDRFLVVVDGKAYATPGEREIVVNRARRQVFALRKSGAVCATARVAVVLTKTDELSKEDFDEFADVKDSLIEAIQSIDDQAICLLIAARPSNGTAACGLDNLIEWICGEDRLSEGNSDRRIVHPSRAIGRFVA